MIDNLPEYIKLKNAYNPAHYPANKKISAEEWNALWLSVMYQGNHQEDVLASILNITIPENITNINNLINVTERIDAKATEALSNSETAVTTADEAKETADNAESIANGIDSKASEALSNSETAVEIADEAKAIALSLEQDKVFDTFADMETWLKDEANKGLHTTGLELFIKDDDVPDYWVTAILETPNASGYYYDIEATEATVLSVNNKKGIVVLKTDDISDTDETNKWSTSEEKEKISKIIINGDGLKALLNNGEYGEVGTVDTVNNVLPDENKNITITADDINYDEESSVKEKLDNLQNGIDYLKDPAKTYLVIKTPADNDTFTLLTGTTGSPNYTIEWGDGTSEAVTTTDNPSHIYETAGMYLITISDSFTNGIVLGFSVNKDKIIEVYGGSNYPTSIGGDAFRGCTNLTTANFPQATFINDHAFNGCTNLTTANLPQVTSIGSSAFYNCTSLTKANFPKATSIGGAAFMRCTSLITANFPKATSIGQYCFHDCTNLTTANFPKATSIGISAFDGCTSLKELMIGNVTNSTYGTRFQNVKLTNLIIAQDVTETDIDRIKQFYADNGGTFIGNETKHGLQVEKQPVADNDVVRKVDLQAIEVDKADKNTTLAGYGITDAYTKTEIESKIASVYKYKGSVANYASLPTENLTIGDVYNVEDTGDNYAWTGSEWDKLSGTVDLSNYATNGQAFNKVYKSLSDLTGIDASSTLEQLCDAMTDNSYLNISTSGCSNLVPTGETDLNGQLEIIKVNANRVRLAWSYQNASRQPIYFATYRNAGGFLGWKRLITDSENQTITGLKNFNADTAKFSISAANTDYRYPLTSPYSTSTDKRFLLGVPASQSRYTNYNSNVYMENDKLYSNGKEVATKQLISQWHVPYRDEAGSGEPNTSRLATMTSPLPSALIIRDAEGKATFVGGTSASQGIVKSQLDSAIATRGGLADDNNWSGVNTFTNNIIGNLQGNASTSTNTARLKGVDTRNNNETPEWYISDGRGATNRMSFLSEFKITSVLGLSGSSYCLVLTVVPWGDATGGLPSQTAYLSNGEVYMRKAASATVWGAWRRLATTEYVDNKLQTVSDEATAETQSLANPDNFYFYEEE